MTRYFALEITFWEMDTWPDESNHSWNEVNGFIQADPRLKLSRQDAVHYFVKRWCTHTHRRLRNFRYSIFERKAKYLCNPQDFFVRYDKIWLQHSEVLLFPEHVSFRIRIYALHCINRDLDPSRLWPSHALFSFSPVARQRRAKRRREKEKKSARLSQKHARRNTEREGKFQIESQTAKYSEFGHRISSIHVK